MQVLFQLFGIEQFAGQNGFLLVFIGIERRNALFRGAVFLLLQAHFFQLVQLAVPRKKERGALADHHIVRGDHNALRLKFADFLDEALRVQGHAIAEHVDHARPEHAGWQQVQHEFAVAVDDGVAGVSAALKAHDNIKVFRQQVYHPALSFISPVDSHNRCAGSHLPSSSWASPIFHNM